MSVLVLVLALAFGGLLVTTPPVRADHDTIGWNVNPFVVAGTFSAEQHSTAFADGNGHVYVFYLVNTAVGFTNLSVRKFTTGLVNFGSPSVLLTRQITTDVTSAGTVNAEFAPSVGMDHSGNLYVAWVKQSGYTGGRSDDVYVSKSPDGGNSWLTPVLASASPAPLGLGSDVWPSLAVGPDGTVWVAYAQDYGGWRNISLSHSSNGAASFTGFANISLPPPGQAFANLFPSLGVDSQGRLYLAYSHQDASAYWHIEAAWSDGGTVWTTQAIGPVTGVNTFVYTPDVLAESNGNVDIAWWDNSFAAWGGDMVWIRRSVDRGATWLPAVQLGGAGGPVENAIAQVHVVALGSNLMVTYESYDSNYEGLGWAISADDGQTWYPARVQTFGHGDTDLSVAIDENGTVWASMTYVFGNNDIELTWWNGPPSPPAVTAVTPGTNSLTVAWSAPPEKNVASYQVWRSADGSTYQAVADVVAPTTSYTDSSLANGMYWYKVVAVNTMGTPSHSSAAASGTVGPTLAQQIANLQNQLNSANANLAAIQAQLNSLKSQLNGMQGNTTDLKNQIAALQNQLNTLQTQQATQTISYANLAFEVIVVVLLVVLLLNQMRRPKHPQMMMAQPGQVAPTRPEDEL